MSMPVTNLDLRGRDDLPDLASVLGHINTAAYLFGDEEKQQNPAASPDVKSYLQMNTTDDKFPILVRRDTNGNGSMQLSASSAALDLALSQSPGPEGQTNGWTGYRHRQAQQSLPNNTLRKQSQAEEYDPGQFNNTVETTPTKNMANNRRSVEFNFGAFSPESKRSSYHASPNGMPKLQQSYSTNDVPTLKNANGVNGVSGNGAFNNRAEQHLHNHNASLGRIPPNGVSNNRHSRELSNGQDYYRSPQSGLHASAAPFGPTMTSAASANGSIAGTVGSPTMSQYSTSTAPYYGYGMSMLNNAMNSLSVGGPQYGAPPAYNPNGYQGVPGVQYGAYNPYAAYGPQARVQDSQARVIQSRRLQNGTCHPHTTEGSMLTKTEDANRFMNYDLKTMPREEIYTLCKDQHGCRFLQKKLEERNTEYLQIIFDETAPHVVELMTGKFFPRFVSLPIF
jgi:hypothetical protein